jgi:hypothetical protein
MQKKTTPTPAMALNVSSNLIFFACFLGGAAILQQLPSHLFRGR